MCDGEAVLRVESERAIAFQRERVRKCGRKRHAKVNSRIPIFIPKSVQQLSGLAEQLLCYPPGMRVGVRRDIDGAAET
jgi:hypothetical protein